MQSGADTVVLHYTGYDDDVGGVVSMVRNLAGAGRFGCVLGVNAGHRQHRAPPLPVLELPRMDGEKIGWMNAWRARRVALEVGSWLDADKGRIFHGHSRAGLLVALWLQWLGKRRVVVSVHCYGRRRWFYRWAARQLGDRLFWLSPAMKRYYGLPGATWRQCIPGGVMPSGVRRTAGQSGRLRLGGVGALVRWKGWHTVLEGLALLPPLVRRQVTFEHIGEGDSSYREELKRLVAANRLEETVRFCGGEPSSARLLGAVDALVVASANEPFSIAMLEALAAGVPVIAADSGGALDVLQNGVNGRLYRTGDAAALGQVLQEWLANPPQWDIARIQATAVTTEQTAAQWAQVYARL